MHAPEPNAPMDLKPLKIQRMGGSDLKSVFNHSWSYHRLQVGFGGACRCRCGELIFGTVLFLPNDLHVRPTVSANGLTFPGALPKRIVAPILTLFKEMY